MLRAAHEEQRESDVGVVDRYDYEATQPFESGIRRVEGLCGDRDAHGLEGKERRWEACGGLAAGRRLSCRPGLVSGTVDVRSLSQADSAEHTYLVWPRLEDNELRDSQCDRQTSLKQPEAPRAVGRGRKTRRQLCQPGYDAYALGVDSPGPPANGGVSAT